jgi:hypothetical protein
MTKKSFNLRNVVAAAICLAGFFSANNALAQVYSYTDDCGVTWNYTLSGSDAVHMGAITTLPTTLTKWVIPDVIIHNGTETRKVTATGDVFTENLPNGNTTLTEIVFPKYMAIVSVANIQADITGAKLTNLHKLTFGEAFFAAGTNAFRYHPLDTVIFKGDAMLTVEQGINGCFQFAPANTKVIVPCGKLEAFVNDFNAHPHYWQGGTQYIGQTWTTANFEEAECLNTLTVLSTDNNLGLTMANCGWLWSNGTNQGNASGAVTLYALPKGGNAFISWNDGNLENPRIVSVSSDTTFTAQFATCTSSGIEEVRSAKAAFQLFPNPAKEQVTVSLPEHTVGTLAVFDLSGKAVKNQAINGASVVINTSAFAAGTYIIRVVKDGRASEGVKFVKE